MGKPTSKKRARPRAPSSGPTADLEPSPEVLRSICETFGLPDGEPFEIYVVRGRVQGSRLTPGDLIIKRRDKAMAITYKLSREAVCFFAAQQIAVAESEAELEMALRHWREAFAAFPSRKKRLRKLASQERRTPQDILGEVLVSAILERLTPDRRVLRKVAVSPRDLLRRPVPKRRASALRSKVVQERNLIPAVLRAVDRELYRLTNQPPSLELESTPDSALPEKGDDGLAQVEMEQILDRLRVAAPPRVQRLIDLLGEAPELLDYRKELARRLGVARNAGYQRFNDLKKVARRRI